MFLLKRLLPSKTKELVWKFASDQLHLKFTLSSGIPIKVASFSDWCIYNEIFADGEYDEGILVALAEASDADFTVLDLGANVGFFTMRVLHLMSKMKIRPRKTSFVLVEASPSLVSELNDRCSTLSSPEVEIRVIAGLVGQRTGSAPFEFHKSQCRNSVGSVTSNALPVEYVDLLPVTSEFAKVNLLKCDIEGSEKEFLNNYGELLQRTDVAMFEFHSEGCKPAEGISLLSACGLQSKKELRGGEPSVWLFWREVSL